MTWHVMDTSADIDLKVVGQIVSATSLIYVFPSEEKIGNFLAPLLTGVPGCQAVSLCFRNLVGPIGDVRAKTCQLCPQRLGPQMKTDQYVCGLAEQDHVWAYPLETVVRTYGYLILTVDRESDYVKYEPFIQNLGNALAIILENRWQQAALQASKVNLEQQVEERTAELNRFFNTSLDLLCIADADAYFRRLNPEWEKTLGYSLADLTGRRFWDFIHPDDLEATRAIMTQLAANATVLNFENRYRCNDGSYRWIEWRALPVGQLIYAAARDVTKRRRTEDALRKSEERYRSLIRTMLNGFSYCRMVFDDQQRPVDFVYLAVNPAFEHLTGLRNVTGKPVTEVIPDIKESNPELFEIYGRVVLTGQPKRFEMYLAPLTRWLVVSAAWAGEGCFAAIFDNITERKLAELALEKNESRLRAIMANMGEGLVVQSADGAITDCNPSAESILGLSRDEIMGKTSVDPSWRAVLEDGRPFAGEEHPAMVSLRTGQPCQNVTMGLRLPDGTQKWINVNAQPILNPGEDRPASVVTTFADITSLKLTEAALRTAAAYARSLLEASLDPLVTISVEGKITDVNDASAQVTGVPREQLIGTDFSDYFTEPAQARAGYQQVFAEGFVRDYPLAIRHISGRVTDVLYNATVYRDAHGQVLGVFAAARDITARKRAEAEQARLQALNQQFQLQKSESLRRMAGAVAHNLNNQLQTVMMGLELAIEDQPQNAVPDTNLTEALQSARKAAGIGDQMLTYLGQTHVEHETLDLSETCQRSLPLLTAGMPKTVGLKTDLPVPGPVIHANTSQIQQVLTHLLTNAWEASRDGSGDIRLTVKPVANADIPVVNRFPVDWQPQAPAYACLEVADAGCGIAATDMEKLFDPFYSSKFTGRGLGLAVVLGIVREHGGGITVTSEPDRGSVFRVFLPVSAVAVFQPPAPVVPAPKKAGHDTVLVVDDDECLRTFVVLALQRKGYTVFSAVDGVEAVELFLQHRDEIDCVLCDLSMPRMDGWETLTALRQLAPGIPVIISSGYSKAAAMAGHHPELPQAFLGKPYELKALFNIINQILSEVRRG